MKGGSSQGFELSEKKRALLEALLREEGVEPQRDRIRRRRTAGPAPLSFAQQRLWFFDQWEPGSILYNLPSALRLRGPLNVAALERALNEVVSRHEALRTTFELANEKPVQVIREAQRFHLEVIDLMEHPAPVREERAQRIANNEATRSFDLTKGPLVAIKLLRMNQDDYLLIITMHHIISDGWSIKIFIREAGALYDAYCAHRESPLPPLELQYADFAVWQREQLQGDVLQGHLEYWRRQLLDAPGAIELAADRLRPNIKTFNGSVLSFELSMKIHAELTELSRQEGVTLFMTLLAAFNVLLYRYSWQEDIVVGSPIANRNRAELEDMMGFFVNTLAMRVDLSGAPSFRELLKRVKEISLEAYAHQDLPFEKLVEELQPERRLSHTPLFQVLFHLQNAVTETVKLSGLSVMPYSIGDNTAKFDLSVTMTEAEDSLRGNFNYNRDLFDQDTIQRVIGHFETLLKGVVTNPSERISRIPILSEDERNLLIRTWNATNRPYPREQTIVSLFEKQARTRPDSIALVFNQETLSYGELNKRANRLARRLLDLQIKADDAVGLCLERNPELVISMLGVLKAGGAFLPLDPGLPRQRMKLMLDVAGLSIVLTQSRLADLLSETSARILKFDMEWPSIEAYSSVNPNLELLSDNLAYAMYTSGSSGSPKGIAVPHRGIIRLVFANDYASFGADEVFLQMAPVGFDASTFEIWGALLHGGRCVLLESNVITADEIREGIASQQATTAWLTSSLFNAITDQDPLALSGIRQLLIGGEALSVKHVEEAQRRLAGTRIVNGYGPTENTTFTCCYELKQEHDDYHRGVPIGKPIANTRVYLLDEEMNPVPIGVQGELYAGGDGLARGYLDSPELTAQAFIPDAYSGESGGRLYKTGDMVRYRADGNIEFIGRSDRQIKLRGYRIEIEEIERVLANHSDVRQCAVEIKEDRSADRALVAYVETSLNAETAQSELRNYLKLRLPEYMIPAIFVPMEALPLTSRGKIDRDALPNPSRVRKLRSTLFAVPGNAIDEVLAGMMSELLGSELVGINDNFFELGGHSLLATQLITRIRRTFHVDVSLKTFFEAPTVAALSHHIAQGKGGKEQAEKIAAVIRKIEMLSDGELEAMLEQKKQKQDLTRIT